MQFNEQSLVNPVSRKRIRIKRNIVTPTGIKQLVTERLRPEYKTDLYTRYQGLQVSHYQEFHAITTFVERGAITRNNATVCILGDTQDIINQDLSTAVRAVNSISGRDKQVANKKARGELRRQRCDLASNFGVSRSKAYHKAKHSSI